MTCILPTETIIVGDDCALHITTLFLLMKLSIFSDMYVIVTLNFLLNFFIIYDYCFTLKLCALQVNLSFLFEIQYYD